MSASSANMRFTPDTPIEYLRLSPRAYNSLLNAGYDTVRDVSVGMNTQQIGSLKGIGVKSNIEIVNAMNDVGFGRNFDYKLS